MVCAGARNVVNACQECKVKRLIYNSPADIVFEIGRDIKEGDESLPYVGKVSVSHGHFLMACGSFPPSLHSKHIFPSLYPFSTRPFYSLAACWLIWRLKQKPWSYLPMILMAFQHVQFALAMSLELVISSSCHCWFIWQNLDGLRFEAICVHFCHLVICGVVM